MQIQISRVCGLTAIVSLSTRCRDCFPLAKVVFPVCFCALFSMLDANYSLCLYYTEQAVAQVQTYGTSGVCRTFVWLLCNRVLCDKMH